MGKEHAGFFSRWIKSLIREVLEEYDMTKFITVYSDRDPTPRDAIYQVGVMWNNQVTGKFFIIKKIEVDWREVDEKGNKK